MARRTVVTYYSDLSGVEIGQEGVGVQFGLDGDSFEIDLSADEHAALQEALAPFVAVARVSRPAPAKSGSTSSQERVATEPDSRTLRLWAHENGFDVPARGRVSELVREAYKAANAHRDVTAISRLLTPPSQSR